MDRVLASAKGTSPCCAPHRDWAHPMPRLHQGYARRCHICIGTGLTPCHVCTRAALTAATSVSGPGSPPAAFAPGLRSPLPLWLSRQAAGWPPLGYRHTHGWACARDVSKRRHGSPVGRGGFRSVCVCVSVCLCVCVSVCGACGACARARARVCVCVVRSVYIGMPLHRALRDVLCMLYAVRSAQGQSPFRSFEYFLATHRPAVSGPFYPQVIHRVPVLLMRY